MTQPLDHFCGPIFQRGSAAYDVHRYQYAFSSHAAEGHMEPAAILSPRSTADLLLALEHAERSGLALALRSGGHHLLGASSTAGPNLLLDLRDTYREFEWDAERDRVRVGVSLSLQHFNAELRRRGLFVPHGQCSHVRLGGHVQTGGWGMLARSFGLLSDYVESIELVTADGEVRRIERDSPDPDARDLFYAVLGGSPGSFGVLTHFTLRPLHDADHPNARGLKFLVPYSRARLEALLDVIVDMAADVDFERDYDFSITALGAPQAYLPFATSSALDERMRVRHPEVYGHNEIVALPAVISVYVQWGNTQGPGQTFDPAFFDRIKAAADYGVPLASAPAAGLARVAAMVRPRALVERVQNGLRLGSAPVGMSAAAPTPMSELAHNWVFPNVREYNLPYVKRAYLSDSTNLRARGWARWVSERFEALVAPRNGCKGFLQVQHMGGRRARFSELDRDGATAHSWRSDSTLCCLMDCFHAEGAKPTAIAWQQRNDAEALGMKIFSDTDRRVFWGPWGELELDAVWQHYFDSRDKYERLRAIKRRVDPQGRWSASRFGICG
jgi:hypothetical protein